MNLPIQSQPVLRKVSTAVHSSGITYSRIGTCRCGGFIGGCSPKEDNCEPGYMPVCDNRFIACGCTCRPI